MATSEWTHPRHKRVAVVTTMADFISVFLCFLVLCVVPWFTDSRNKDFKSGYIYNKDIGCRDNKCIRLPENHAGLEGWQEVAVNLLYAGFTVGAMSFIVLLFMFWPVTCLSSKVPNILLRIAKLFNIVAAPCKFICGFIFVIYSGEINRIYSWNAAKGYYQLDSLPIGLLFASFLFDVFTIMGLMVALDVGPPGGPTYLEQIEEERRIAQMEEEEAEEIGMKKDGTYNFVTRKRKSSYMPDSTASRMRVLSKVEANAPWNWTGTPV